VQSTNKRPMLGNYSLSADSQSMFGLYIVDTSPTDHRWTTDISPTLVLYIVSTTASSYCFEAFHHQSDKNKVISIFKTLCELGEDLLGMGNK